MSYFGQKKKQKRINVFLAASLSLVAILLFLALLIRKRLFPYGLTAAVSRFTFLRLLL